MNQTQKSGWNHLKLPTHAEPSLPHADVIGMDRIGDELFELLPRNAALASIGSGTRRATWSSTPKPGEFVVMWV